jgi:hypothetical protein
MMDISDAATAAIDLLRNHFSDVAAGIGESAATAVGKKLFDWFKAKFTSSSESDALSKLAANPKSNGPANLLLGALQMRIEGDRRLMQELATILNAAKTSDQSLHQDVRISGDSNTSAQVAGTANEVTISKG